MRAETANASAGLELATFEVTDHYELPQRAAFVIGQIRSGVFRCGMSVSTRDGAMSLTISGIESLDNLALGQHSNALSFRERPTLDELRQQFPVGSILAAE